MFEVLAIPRTLSGKKTEVPVKRVLAGAEPHTVLNLSTLTDPNALAPFVAYARSRIS
ncbi:hypothetical protein ACW9HR_22885 [Nocardia gipuzkoensis]